MPHFERIIPVLTYRDIPPAHDFLVAAFGFTSGGVSLMRRADLERTWPLSWRADLISSSSIWYLASLGVLYHAALLRSWSERTPRAIFPDRRIGRWRPGTTRASSC